MNLRDRRVQYQTAGLEIGDLDSNPITQWQLWYNQANDADVAEPNAMIVTTVDDNCKPDARVVLVRHVDDAGFGFYTNYDSPKSRQIATRPVACGVFAWLDLHRQVRVSGNVVRIPEQQCDQYFASRPRESQIGAWASPQSQPISSREWLDRQVAEVEEKFSGVEVPRPENWGGWSISPYSIEFWQGRPNRLHDRFRYTRSIDTNSTKWKIQRIAP